MSVGRKLGVLVVAAAGVCALGTVQQRAFAQQPQPAAAQQFPPQLTDTPVAPPNTDAMRLAGIAKDNSRMFGSDPDDPGPLAKGLSARLTVKAVDAATRKVADWQLAQSQQYFGVIDARATFGRRAG